MGTRGLGGGGKQGRWVLMEDGYRREGTGCSPWLLSLQEREGVTAGACVRWRGGRRVENERA